MGFALLNDEIPLVKATNCILIPSKQEIVTKKDALPCIRCGLCASACPVSLLPQQLFWYSKSDQLDKAEDHNLFDCIECGCCDVVWPKPYSVGATFSACKKAPLMCAIMNTINRILLVSGLRHVKNALPLKKQNEPNARVRKKERLKNKPAKAEIQQAVARSKEKKGCCNINGYQQTN